MNKLCSILPYFFGRSINTTIFKRLSPSLKDCSNSGMNIYTTKNCANSSIITLSYLNCNISNPLLFKVACVHVLESNMT